MSGGVPLRRFNLKYVISIHLHRIYKLSFISLVCRSSDMKIYNKGSKLVVGNNLWLTESSETFCLLEKSLI